jgi:ABC transport system ATP-binding/permease protein
MDAINGFRPGTHGTVYANGTNLYENFDMFRNDMGYVPQKDIVHMELTVYKALDYAAQLRMPADVTPEERHQRILEVLADLDLSERKDLPIHKLSGGQLKRVSIGVELLTKPRLFFLDEPTSGLDPGTEYNMMRLLRKLADQGRTIMLITHATKNVMMCDKVIILVRGGRLAFYGPPEEALVYFDAHRTEYERRIKAMEFDDIYTILEDETRGEPQDWHERYQQSSAYQKYVVDRLQAAQVELRTGHACRCPSEAGQAHLRRCGNS